MDFGQEPVAAVKHGQVMPEYSMAESSPKALEMTQIQAPSEVNSIQAAIHESQATGPTSSAVDVKPAESVDVSAASKSEVSQACGHYGLQPKTLEVE